MTIDSPPSPVPVTLPLVRLPEYALFRATGADATGFLHGQLTQDIEHLTASPARLAGYCSPKGRLLATLLTWRDDDDILMLARADAAPALTKRLAMFVLRAKVKLIPCSQAIYGAMQALDEPSDDTLPQSAWACQARTDGTWIALPGADGTPRQWLVIPTSDTVMPSHSPEMADIWRATHLRAGIAWIGGTTADLFTPQNVNFDCVGGVNFRKGCYPGQEVVARSHYRGALKRRMGLGTLSKQETVAIPGTDVYTEERPDEPVGRIVASAGHTVLLDAPIEAFSGAISLRYGSHDGTPILLQTLPYSLDKPAP